jgi:hypothetical protein
MVHDLARLLATCPPEASLQDYKAAVMDENVLGKPTASAQRFGFRGLKEFYALDRELLIFRTLRELWDWETEAQPMLALLCATARDPILRAITPFLLSLPLGSTVRPGMISEEAERRFPGKFGDSTRLPLGRNAASSWEQAGLLYEKRDKERVRPQPRAASVAYALLLGDLCVTRGRALFDTCWTRMFDTGFETLREQAIAASRQGWLEYRASGDVIEISFRHLLQAETA